MAETKAQAAQSAAAAESTPAAAPAPVLQTEAKAADSDERGPRFAVEFGTRGALVADLQSALNKKLDKDSQLEVDGVYGQATGAAVKAWQRSEGYAADGAVSAEQAKKLGF